MKKANLRKLTLRKSVIAALNPAQQNSIIGGEDSSSCSSANIVCHNNTRNGVCDDLPELYNNTQRGICHTLLCIQP